MPMRILQIFHFRPPKDKTDGEIFDFILNNLKPYGYDAKGIQFCFENRPASISKIDSVLRVVKNFPVLGRFRGSFQMAPDRDQMKLLSNNGAKCMSD
jgi:hypothetical protein